MAKGITHKDLNNIKSNHKQNTSQEPNNIKSIRHRRDKTTDIYSKGQKKRLLKKARRYKRIEFVNTLQSNIRNIKKEEKPEKENFYFSKIDDEIENIIQSEIEKENENKKKEIKSNLNLSNNKNKRKKIKNVILIEQSKIMQALNNPKFHSNPRQAITDHIKTVQLIEKRKKEMKLNMEKNIKYINDINKE